jgi:hypothetical protein
MTVPEATKMVAGIIEFDDKVYKWKKDIFYFFS